MNPYDQPWNESHKQTQFDLPKDVQLGVGGWFNQHQDNKYIKGLVLGWFLKTCCLCYQTYCGTDFFLTRIETTAFVWIHPEFFFGTHRTWWSWPSWMRSCYVQPSSFLDPTDTEVLFWVVFAVSDSKKNHKRPFKAMSTPELVTYSNPLRRLSFFVQKISPKYRKKIDETLGFHFRGSESCPGNFGTQKTSLNNQRWGVSPHPESISSLVCCFGGPVEIIERCFQTLLSVFVWKDEFVGASKIPQKGRNELL